MEHIIIKQMSDGYVQLRAAEGYRLFSKSLGAIVSEAVVKENKVNQFEAIADD